MPETWTGELIGRMHNARVSLEDIAKEMCCTKAYVSMILNGSRNPPNARQRLEAAFENIVSHRVNDAVWQLKAGSELTVRIPPKGE